MVNVPSCAVLVLEFDASYKSFELQAVLLHEDDGTHKSAEPAMSE